MDNSNNALHEMDKLPVSRAVRMNVVPAVLTMLMSLVYNMADKVFIRMAGNDYMVATVTLAMPVFVLFTSFGNIFGTGGVSLISKFTGLGKPKERDKTSSFCLYGAAGIGVILMIILLAFKTPIVRMLGANNPATIGFARDYLEYIAISCPFAILSQTISSLVRADGKPNLSMIGMVLGNVMNIILDPIFILGLGMGTKGAAIATMLGQIGSAVFYLICILKKKCTLNFRIKDLELKSRIAWQVIAIGTPAALGSIFQSVCNILMNNRMAVYGDIAVAGLGASQNIVTIICIFSIGVGMGIQPLIGYQMGTKNKERFKSIVQYSIKLTLICCLSLTALCYIFTKPVVMAFVSGQEATALGVSLARIVMSTAWLYAVFTVIALILQAMGESVSSLVVTMSRNGYIYMPVLFIMSAAAGMYGVAWAYPISDVICIIIAIYAVVRAGKKAFPVLQNKEVEEKITAI